MRQQWETYQRRQAQKLGLGATTTRLPIVIDDQRRLLVRDHELAFDGVLETASAALDFNKKHPNAWKWALGALVVGPLLMGLAFGLTFRKRT